MTTSTIRMLDALRARHGADSQIGGVASNLIEALIELPGYVQPAWATDPRQTLPWMIEHQVRRLAGAQ